MVCSNIIMMLVLSVFYRNFPNVSVSDNYGIHTLQNEIFREIVAAGLIK